MHFEKYSIIFDNIGDFFQQVSQKSSFETLSKNDDTHIEIQKAGDVASVLIGAGKDFQNSSTKAKAVQLIFYQERLKLEIKQAQLAMERGQKRISLLEDQRTAFFSEQIRLNNILNQVSNENENKLFSTTVNKIRAIFLLAETFTIDRLRQEEIEEELMYLAHDQALDTSEFALNQWKLMIATPLEELVGYHASGITKEDIANLFHAAALAAIAVGVIK